MNASLLVTTAISKFPMAKRIAVENFTSGYDNLNMEASMNLSADTACYRWNAHTVKAIKYVLNNKPKNAR
jgi:hypothetical protein